jgi:uncharacterized protein (TIGR02996 family)
MSDEPALLAAILDRPDEDTPRLVYADWLEDHGEPERAAFIREQIEIARSPDGRVTWRACELRAQLSEPIDGFHAWANPASYSQSGHPRKCLYARGFVEHVTCPAADWRDHGSAILADHPVRLVTLTTSPVWVPGWPGDPAYFTADSRCYYKAWPGVAFRLPVMAAGRPVRV